MSIYLVFLILIVSIVTIFVGVMWLLLLRIEIKHNNFVFKQANSVRTLIVNRDTNTVKFFNRNRLREVREVDMNQFYSQVSSRDKERLEEWFNALLRKNSTASEYIEVEVFMNRNRRKYLTLLKATDVNHLTRVIHIESYVFIHLSTRSRLGYKLSDVPLEDAINKLKIKPTIRGSTINFKFTFVNRNSTQTTVDKLLFTQIKEVAVQYAYPPQKYLIETGESEFTIIDFRTSELNSITNYIHTIVNSIKKFLQINSVLINTSISVGVVANRHFPNNAKKLIAKAEEMANVAHEKNTLIISYDRNYENEENHDSEIERIIKERKLSYSFVPIYGVKEEKVVGYISSCRPTNASVRTIDELYLRSVKTIENKKLLQSIVKDSTAIFSSLNSNPEVRLFRFLRFADCQSFLEVKSTIRAAVKYVICFDEYDISYYISKNADFYDVINKLIKRNVEICLILSDKSSILDGKIYSIFDYFIVNKKDDKNKRFQNSTNIEYRVICEKLLKYHRPIILSNVEGWTMVELLVRSGIEYIASGTIAPVSEILSIPSMKNIEKIRKMLD